MHEMPPDSSRTLGRPPMAIRNSTDHMIHGYPKNRAHESRVLRHSDSKQEWKEISKVLPSANMENQISTFKN
jgi:hypothetical protein